MKTDNKQKARNLALCGVLIALATALSMIQVIKMPLGGSVTPFSMVPIVMISVMLGTKWGVGSAFCYAAIQLGLGIAMDGVLGWGLTPASLTGTIFLDYLIPFTLLGFTGIFAKKGTVAIGLTTAAAVFLRFLCHLISGVIIFDIWCPWDRVWLYSFCYNGAYMLPELIITVAGALLLFRLPQIKKLTARP